MTQVEKRAEPFPPVALDVDAVNSAVVEINERGNSPLEEYGANDDNDEWCFIGTVGMDAARSPNEPMETRMTIERNTQPLYTEDALDKLALQVSEFIQNDREAYGKVLCFEPLDLPRLQAELLSKAQLRVSRASLARALSSQGVRFGA